MREWRERFVGGEGRTGSGRSHEGSSLLEDRERELVLIFVLFVVESGFRNRKGGRGWEGLVRERTEAFGARRRRWGRIRGRHGALRVRGRRRR